MRLAAARFTRDREARKTFWWGYWTENLEPGLRQTIEWVDPPDSSSRTTGTTRIALDVNLAPELGIKLYIGERAFLVLGRELDAVFGSGSDLDEAWDDASVLSTIGIGYYW